MASSLSSPAFLPAPSMVATATTPPMTIMHSTLGVSSTTQAISTSSSTEQGTITTFDRFWGTAPYIEAYVAAQLNPYVTLDGVPWYTFSRKEHEDPSLYSTCGFAWRSSFFQWAPTAIDISILSGYSCYDYAPSPKWYCPDRWPRTTRGPNITCSNTVFVGDSEYPLANGAEAAACAYLGANQSSITCYNSVETPKWTCNDHSTPEYGFEMAFSTAGKAFPFTASPPCCGSCTFTAGNVQVYYWPSATSSPATTLLVNTEGFTFTYPSVYVAFETIAASDLCRRGRTIDGVTTMAFDASDLSTAMSYYPISGDPENKLLSLVSSGWWAYSEIDFKTSITCLNLTTTLWARNNGGFDATSIVNITTFTNTLEYLHTTMTTTETETLWSDGPFPLLYNPCTPFLSVPSQIIAIDPMFSTCHLDFKGLHDPPKIMDSTNGFFPPISKTGSRTNDAPVTPKIFESPEETQGAQARPAIPQPVVAQTALVGTSDQSSGTIVFVEPVGIDLETLTLAAGGPEETVDGMELSLISGSGGESVVVGGGSRGSFTEDVGALTGGGLGTGEHSSSVGGGTMLTSGSGKMEIGVLIFWQLASYCLLS